MKIYFAGSIRAGRQDIAIYQQVVACLKIYGTVLTEHVAFPELEIRWLKREKFALFNYFVLFNFLQWKTV